MELIRSIRKDKLKIIEKETELTKLRVSRLEREDAAVTVKINTIQAQINERQADLRKNSDVLLLAEERARYEVEVQKAKERGIKTVVSRLKTEAHHTDLVHKSVAEFLAFHNAIEKRVIEMNSKSGSSNIGCDGSSADNVAPVFPSLTPQQLGFNSVVRKTLAFYDPDSLMHRTPSFHCESVQRIVNMVEMLEELNLHPSNALRIVRGAAPADESLITRVHDEEYIKTIQSSLPVYPINPPAIFCPGAAGIKSEELDPENFDTFLTWGSWMAAKRAAGIVCAAIRAVSAGECKNAFCAIRPPGHHAGRTGETENTSSQGFCLINNVAIGATYAVEELGYKRVAVVDFDVHHGNGTQDILGGKEGFLFISIHVYDEKKYFYPGTGNAGDGPDNVLNVPLKRHTGSSAYLQEFEGKVIDRLKQFKPQLLLISAGFDAHKDDPIRGLKLCTNDFYIITRMLLKVGKKYCTDRVVSVLEGGYDTNPKTNALQISAHSHVLALMGQESPEGTTVIGHYAKKRVEIRPPEIESLSPSSSTDIDEPAGYDRSAVFGIDNVENVDGMGGVSLKKSSSDLVEVGVKDPSARDDATALVDVSSDNVMNGAELARDVIAENEKDVEMDEEDDNEDEKERSPDEGEGDNEKECANDNSSEKGEAVDHVDEGDNNPEKKADASENVVEKLCENNDNGNDSSYKSEEPLVGDDSKTEDVEGNGDDDDELSDDSNDENDKDSLESSASDGVNGNNSNGMDVEDAEVDLKGDDDAKQEKDSNSSNDSADDRPKNENENENDVPVSSENSNLGNDNKSSNPMEKSAEDNNIENSNDSECNESNDSATESESKTETRNMDNENNDGKNN